MAQTLTGDLGTGGLAPDRSQGRTGACWEDRRRQQRPGPTTRLIPPPLTFAFVSRVAGQGVSIETLLAAVAEEAVRVVDALETFPGFTVTVADRVGVDVVAALAGAAGSDRSAPAQRVPEEAVVTELAALTYRDDIRQDDLRDSQPAPPTSDQDSPVVPVGQLVQTTSLVLRTRAQVAPAGQGHGWQSDGVPPLASP